MKLTIYLGKYGNINKSAQVQQYAGTSGGEGYQNSNNQNIPDAGPVPSGDYKINLEPDFTRKVKTNSDGSTKPNPDGGVELLPWGNGSLYSEWGQWRARLDKVNVNSTRNDFYLHDSYKGYSHGCIETNTALYYDLSKYKRGGKNPLKFKLNIHLILQQMVALNSFHHHGGMASLCIKALMVDIGPNRVVISLIKLKCNKYEKTFCWCHTNHFSLYARSTG